MSSVRLLLIAAILGCGVALRVGPPMPDGVRFVPRAEWGAKDPVMPMRTHVPVRLTIHHTGTPQAPTRTVEAKLAALQAFSQRDDSLASGQKKPAWPDVPYHFYVATDGSLAEGRDWRYVGDSNTAYDPTGHLLVVVEGNFQTDTLTTAQRRALYAIVPVFARHFRIPPEMLGAHRDFASTSCPGEKLYAELPHLRSLIAAAR